MNRVYAIPGLADGSLSSPAFTYDPAGNLRTVRLNSGVTSTLTPDKLNRLASIQVSSPRLSNPVLSLAYTHDGEGNILTRNENLYRYDELDRLIYSQVKGIFSDDLPARRGYVTGDFVGDRALGYSTGDATPVSFDYASSSVGLDFGSSAQVRRVFLTKDDPAVDTSRIKPNTLDLYGSADGSTFTRLDPSTYTLKATLDGLVFEFGELQSLQQLKVHSKFDERNEDGTFTDKATFKNALGELIKAEQEVSQATLEYGYDAVGNRTYERFTKAATHSKDYVYYANSNRLLTDGKYAFVYDKDGNLIKKGNRFTLAGETVYFTTDGKGVEYWEYSYNLRNQLTKVTKNGQLVATYAYDGLGLRVSATTTITSKTTGQAKTTTRDYVFDLADRVIYDKVASNTGQLPASEDPETSTENSYVFANGTHFAKVEGPIGTSAELCYYHNDHLGSPMAITDSQGNVAWSQDYLPYGEALNETATATRTRFTFTGKELDPATGLMYYNARWYDPDLGRFMTEDTYAGDPNQPQTLNRHIYVMGNPLKYTDPTGHDVGAPGDYGSISDEELNDVQRIYDDLGIDVDAEKMFDEAGIPSEREYEAERQARQQREESALSRTWEEMHGSARENHDVAIAVVAIVLGPKAGKDVGGLLKTWYDKIAATITSLLSRTDEKIKKAIDYVLSDPIKTNHIFGKTKHGLDPLVQKLGGKENLLREILEKLHDLPQCGVFERVIEVGGQHVTVRGAVVDGIPKIGTIFIK